MRGRYPISLFGVLILTTWFSVVSSQAQVRKTPTPVRVSGQAAQAAISGATIDTSAGNGVAGYAGDNGPALLSRLKKPQDAAVHPDGFVLIADTDNHRVRKYNPNTGIISLFAGNGTAGFSGNLRSATEAAVASPRSVLIDSIGNVYIASLYQIRIVNPQGTIDLFAGSLEGDAGDNVPARSAQFRTIGGMAFDTDGGIVFADMENNKIRKVGLDGSVITLAGTGLAGSSGDQGPASLATLNTPFDVAVDPAGRIYIAERSNSSIRMIENGFIFTVYSSVTDPTFSRPKGLEIYKDLFLYISSDDHYIRRMNLFNKQVVTLAGNGFSGFTGDKGPSENAQVSGPTGMGLDPDGNLYIADTSNHRLRVIYNPPISIAPTPTPTPTYTPSPSFTPGPTNTPTRTPRLRTATPTRTPFLTATPTATPTGLPQGQLAPNIPSGISIGAKYVFYVNQTWVNIPFDPKFGKVRVALSSTPDGSGLLLTRDTIALTVRHAAGTVSDSTTIFTDLSKPLPPVNITNHFKQGLNSVSVRLIDSKGAGFSSYALYIVVFTAPELKDIPDLRALVGEELTDVYRVDDFLSDQDTPLEDITWYFKKVPDKPQITFSEDHMISVAPSFEPLEASFIIAATDGIFEATDEIKIKVSTFRIQDFLLPDAPLVDDFAYVSPYSLRFLLDPPGVNIADVPLEATHAADRQIRNGNVARGTVYLFPEFPGGKVKNATDISISGKRLNNPLDWDGAVIQTSSVVPPLNGDTERNYNFTAKSFAETNWMIVAPTNKGGEVNLGYITNDPVQYITDGYGAIISLDPGETSALLSAPIPLLPGPHTVSIWISVDKLDNNQTDLPTITLALAEDSSNLSYTTIRGEEIIGDGRYQYLSTTYDVIGPQTQALIQVSGTHRSGKAEVFLDNLRVFPAKRDIDRALGLTELPVEFDGSFETVLRGLGVLFEINQEVSFGSAAYIQGGTNRTVKPGGYNQSLILSLDQPTSAIQLLVGPNFVEPNLLPRYLTARAHLQVIRDGGGFFAIGLTNGYQEAVSFISNDRLPEGPDWHRVSATGVFSKPGLFDPIIILQNQNAPGAFPGVILDGANLAVDDITLEAFQDKPYFWDSKRLQRGK